MEKTTLKPILYIVGLIIGSGIIYISSQKFQISSTADIEQTELAITPEIPHNNPSPPASSVLDSQIPSELVCMVNDAFMGIKQFPVPVGNKIYYGCCENCVDKLQKTDEFRYGIDPLTKEKVDKVDAFIVRQSDKNYSVFYFKSKDNYEKYLQMKSS